jgi:hypothetical protein
MDKARFSEHFRKFEARENQETMEGTPLAEWPGVTRSQAEELKFYNVLTVEQLVGMSDTNAQNFRGMGELRKRAKAFLDVAKENAGAEALAASARENAELKATIAALAKRLDAMEAEEDDSVPDFEAPKKATRRRKA